jgi:Immunity protein 8
MRAKLNSVHSPDIWDLERYQPELSDNFGFLLQLMIGNNETLGEDTFDIIVCTPSWLKDRYPKDHILMGRSHLIVFEYDYVRMMKFLGEYCSGCCGQSWVEIANQLSRLGDWEFENAPPPS